MNTPAPDPLSRIAIPPEKRGPRQGVAWMTFWLIAGTLLALLLVSNFIPRGAGDSQPAASASSNPTPVLKPPPPAGVNGTDPHRAILTATGYIIPRERLELSSKFPGTVKWIGVKQGDTVKKGEVIVKLEDAEYRARYQEAQGRLAMAQANAAHAQAQYERQQALHRSESATSQELDDARQALETAQAEVQMVQGQLALAQTWLDWCSITAPIDGTILEKRVDEQEQVIPQGLGMDRGPSTTLVTLADLSDLQVEVDVNEHDTAKVHRQQRCAITPEAYPDKVYTGYVAEIAPEADRQKGTLEVKVQILKPDPFLIPGLTAKVEFLAGHP